MGNLANTVISVLMSWVRQAASALWQWINAGGDGMTWLASNWLWLAALLCLAGTAVDLAVYFFRWRPAEVWKSYIRRKKRGEAAEPEKQREHVRTLVYADGRDETRAVPTEEWAEPQEETAAEQEQQNEPEESAPARQRRSERYHKSKLALLRRHGAQEEEEEVTAPAFRDAVYPEQWTGGSQPVQRKRS